jgi:hypothetical protein
MLEDNCEIRQIRITSLVRVPKDARFSGSLIILANGEEYSVAPAVYKVTPLPPGTVNSALASEAENAPTFQVDYVPYHQWPDCVALDNAVLASFSEPLDAEVV